MEINGYTLANPEKLDRAINGAIGSKGQLIGGVGEDADESAIIAEYDRLGGLILKDGKYKVKTGSFYDVKGKKAIAKPKPTLLFNVNGETVEVPADEPLPLEVRAAEAAGDKKKARAKTTAAAKSAAKAKAPKKGKKAIEGDEEEEDAVDKANGKPADEEVEEDGELA